MSNYSRQSIQSDKCNNAISDAVRHMGHVFRFEELTSTIKDLLSSVHPDSW